MAETGFLKPAKVAYRVLPLKWLHQLMACLGKASDQNLQMFVGHSAAFERCERRLFTASHSPVSLLISENSKGEKKSLPLKIPPKRW